MRLDALVSPPPGQPLGLATVALICGLVALYFLPILVAAARGSLSLRRVARLDLHLGWTGVGWLAALVIACTSPVRTRR